MAAIFDLYTQFEKFLKVLARMSIQISMAKTQCIFLNRKSGFLKEAPMMIPSVELQECPSN